MDTQDVIHYRLHNQQLTQTKFKTPGEVVKHLGAVQAQDFPGSLWSIGLRMKNIKNDNEIEKAITDKTIVRTWPMRGTLHFVSPENIRWMLKYLAPRVITKLTSYYKKEGLTQEVFSKSRKLVVKALEKEKYLTRDELYQILEKENIATKSPKGLFILGEIAHEGLICFGPRKGKQQTFVLVDEWLPKFKDISKEEALAKLALMYFQSHGPATLDDLAWWAGLNKTEAKLAAELIKTKLVEETINSKTYYMPEIKSHKLKGIRPCVYLLPPYDEYTIAYKDRTEILPPSDIKILNSGSGFWSSMILDGKIVGMWRRTIEKGRINLSLAPIYKFDRSIKEMFEIEAYKYAKFFGKQVDLVWNENV